MQPARPPVAFFLSGFPDGHGEDGNFSSGKRLAPPGFSTVERRNGRLAAGVELEATAKVVSDAKRRALVINDWPQSG